MRLYLEQEYEMLFRPEPFYLRVYGLRGFFAVVLACVLLSGCGGGSSSPINIHGNGTSGVRGTAFVLGADGTTSIPFPHAVITVQKTNDQGTGTASSITFGPVVAQTQADAQGNYSIALTPGSYGIGGQATQPNNCRGVKGSYYVSSGQYLQVNVAFTKPTP